MDSVKQIRDAAIVLDSLPNRTKQDVLSHLDEDSRKQLLASMDALEIVSGAEFHKATHRFHSESDPGHSPSPSSPDLQLRRFENWPSDSLVDQKEPFSFLVHLRSDARRRLLEAEHPLNVAMILTGLSPAHASAVTRELDPAFRVSVIRRLCHIDVVDDAKVMELRYGLRMRARRMLAIEHCTRQGLAVAADLLSVSDRQTQDSVLAWLSDRDHELGDELKKRMITMRDLTKFTDLEMGKLLKRVDTSAWAGALRSTVPSVAKRVLQCMAPRAADIVTKEMEAFDPLDDKATQWAVEQVMTAAVKLRKEIPAADKPAWRVGKKRPKVQSKNATSEP